MDNKESSMDAESPSEETDELLMMPTDVDRGWHHPHRPNFRPRLWFWVISPAFLIALIIAYFCGMLPLAAVSKYDFHEKACDLLYVSCF